MKRIAGHISRTATAAAIALGLSAPAAAQETPEHMRALVAGYKAAFTCSATFNAGRSPESIAALELNRIYPGYREILAELPAAKIDRARKMVSVSYSEQMPPRVSAWRPHLGCAQLPIGAEADVAAELPRVTLAAVPQGNDKPWPLGDKAKPASAADLAEIIARAFDGKTYGAGTETSAVVVSRSSELLGERYRAGYDLHTSQRTWSVAKSIAATVVGIAVGDGVLKLDEPAPVPEWQSPLDPRRGITLANLLHMSSGLYSGQSGSRTDQIYAGGARITDRATEAPLDALPGSRWRYANNDTLLAVRSLRASLGSDADYLRYPFEKLLHRIGMRDTLLETDWEGNFVMSSQVWTTARDLARLGILYLNDGVWAGERVLPADWVDYVRTPAPQQPPALNSRGEPGWGYGAQWWLLGERFQLPKDGFMAAGHRGQYVFVVPSLDLVIVRRGYDESGGQQFDIAAFARDIIAAL
ncbi:CubicO group peptidase, beta-lactamase class C family [Microbulbifer donghaiensis]|uniref:CubicO group peptidase, beta-lactamase class C family n=1 Tax=Microbulbifer donghaiensis TaxID=494016 RepID=A0A1M4WSE8_9GAMM|nr:serine hydrolase [Microbulbifer donghaiensis]SHE84144.1 CubicO group peptidase, beta-lactamase class C family [Microbulbifer donghaiensis]